MEEIIFNVHLENGYAFRNKLEVYSKLGVNLIVLISPNNIKLTNKSYEIDLGQGKIEEWIYDEDLLGKQHHLILFNFTFLDKIKEININDSVRLFLIRGKEGLMIEII